jgi:hypothetical protein
MSKFRDVLEWLLILICFWIALWIAIWTAFGIVYLVYNLLF